MDDVRFSLAPAPSFQASADVRRIRLVPEDAIHDIDRRFLSFGLDIEQVVDVGPAASPVDLDQPSLVALTRALSPAYLRVSGPTADRTYYSLRSRPKAAPNGCAAALSAARWDAAVSFVQDAGLALMFTLNAGPYARAGRQGPWSTEQARLLIDHAAARRDPVLVWAFGHGGHRGAAAFGNDAIGPTRYAQDLRTATDLIRARSRGSLLSADLAGLPPDEPSLADAVDVATWHHTTRSPGHAQPEAPELDAVLESARRAEGLRASHRAEGRPLWLAESRFDEVPQGLGSSVRWVDHLGSLARRGHSVVIRRRLLGGPGALIDEPGRQPRPDFWASVLWKQLMGREVLAPVIEDAQDTLRAYAHWTPDQTGFPEQCVTLLLINLAPDSTCIELPQLPSRSGLAFRFNESSDGSSVQINGWPAGVESDGALPPIVAHRESFEDGYPRLFLAPRSFGFFVLAPSGASFA